MSEETTVANPWFFSAVLPDFLTEDSISIPKISLLVLLAGLLIPLTISRWRWCPKKQKKSLPGRFLKIDFCIFIVFHLFVLSLHSLVNLSDYTIVWSLNCVISQWVMRHCVLWWSVQGLSYWSLNHGPCMGSQC